MKYIKKFNNETERQNYLSNNFVVPHIHLEAENDIIYYMYRMIPIEYLENHNSEFIDTGIYATNLTHAIIKGQFNDGSNDYNNFGAGTLEDDGGAKNRFQIMCKSNSQFHFGVGTKYLNAKMHDKDPHIFELHGNGTAKIDDETYNLPNADLVQTTKTIYLFAINNTNINKGKNIRIYSCKIYEDDELILDLIPVRIGQIGYMYDKIQNKILKNKGTGDFILGPDI